MSWNEPLVDPELNIGPFPHQPSPPHSRLGVASFVVVLVALAGGVVACVLVGMVSVALHDDHPLVYAAMLIGFLFYSLLPFGLGMAVGDLVQRDRAKLFAILTIVLGLVSILAALMLLTAALLEEALAEPMQGADHLQVRSREVSSKSAYTLCSPSIKRSRSSALV